MRSLSSAAEHDDSGARLGRAVFDHRDYYCVSYARQGQKVCFDIAKFDAVAAELDLRIHAALEKKKVITKSALVASSISAPTAALTTDGRREIGTSKVARANIWPRDDDFASLV